jgi:hypothetical protein
VIFLFCSSNAANATAHVCMIIVVASSIATKFHEDFEICVFKIGRVFYAILCFQVFV